MVGNTFTLFISSTFEDFKNEREILNIRVFPKINHFCESKGYHFEMVDLRFGIRNESSLNQKTMSICLEEVQRCQNGPRPNFLLMVGNRYGWVPLPDTISDYNYQILQKYMDNDERELIDEWYKLDNNNIPPLYVLKSREGAYIDQSSWLEIENKIRNILQRVSEKAFGKENAVKLCGLSATEREMNKAIGSNAVAFSGTCIVFRNDNNFPDNETKEFRKRIKGIIDVSDGSSQLYELFVNQQYYQTFENSIVEYLIETISLEIERISKITGLSFQEKAEIFAHNATMSFVGQEDLIDQCVTYINDKNDDHILLLHGESGCGKSTLMAKIFSGSSLDNKIGYFYDQQDGIPSLLGVLQYVVDLICTKYDIAHMRLKYSDAFYCFRQILETVNHTTYLLIMIDGLDKFNDLLLFKEPMFDFTLRRGIKIILSSAEETFGLFDHQVITSIHLKGFSRNTAKVLFYDLLNSKERALCKTHARIVEPLLTDDTLPITVVVLAEICKNLRSYDELILLGSDSNMLLKQHIRNMSVKEGHSPTLVSYVFAYLSVAPAGLTIAELSTLLWETEGVTDECLEREGQWQLLQDFQMLGSLPTVYCTRLFYDLGEIIHVVEDGGYNLIQLGHASYKEIIDEALKKTARNTLIHFFEKESNVSVDGSPNKRKILSLLPLLQDNEKLKNRYLESEDFVAQAIRLQQYEYLVSLYSLKDGDNKSNIYKTLMGQRKAILSYPDYFNSIHSSKCFYIKKKELFEGTQYNMMPFPYPQNSNVVFSANGNYVLVSNKRTIYLWNIEQKIEIRRINLDYSRHSRESG